MTKQTVEKAIAAIKVETTTESIKAILMDSTKADIVKIHDVLTGSEYGYSVNGKRKDELATYVAERIEHARKDDAFRALTVKEKLCELKGMKCSAVVSALVLCTAEELRTLAEMLGVNAEEPDGMAEWEVRGFWSMVVEDALKALRAESEVRDAVERGASVKDDETEEGEKIFDEMKYQPEERRADTGGKRGKMTEADRAMLRRYVDLHVTVRIVRDGIRFFQRMEASSVKAGEDVSHLLKAIKELKEKYRKLRLESLTLRRKLLLVMSDLEIRLKCALYEMRCREIQRRYSGK